MKNVNIEIFSYKFYNNIKSYHNNIYNLDENYHIHINIFEILSITTSITKRLYI